MFERFRKSHSARADATSVATPEREARADASREGTMREMDPAATDRESARFARESPGERDRGVVAGGGEADLAGERGFEHDRMARTGDAALDREHARDDLGRDDTARADEGPVARDHEHGTGKAVAAGIAGAAGGAAVEHHREREDEAARDRTMAGDSTIARDRTVAGDRIMGGDRVERHSPVLAPAALQTMRARQRDLFGGIRWGSDFFGWLCAIGLASILTAALVGAGVALGLSTTDATKADTAQQIGLGGGIALLVVLAIAWFCGGYVAGRMARFDGARQGLGVWAWTIFAVVVVAAIAAIGGTGYDIYERLNLPRIAVGDSTLTAGGAIAGAAAILVTLLFAVIGGMVGERYHRRVDRVATDEYVVER